MPETVASLSIRHIVTIPQGIRLLIYFTSNKWHVSTTKHVNISNAIVAGESVGNRVTTVMKDLKLTLDTFLASHDKDYCYEYMLCDKTLLAPDAVKRKNALVPISKRNLKTMELTYTFEKSYVIASYSTEHGKTSLATVAQIVDQFLNTREDCLDMWVIPSVEHEVILSFAREEYLELCSILEKPIMEFTGDEYVKFSCFYTDQSMCLYLLSFVSSLSFKAVNYERKLLDVMNEVIKETSLTKEPYAKKSSARRLIMAMRIKHSALKGDLQPDLLLVKRMIVSHPWIMNDFM
jgi:hypothetical protein